MDSCNKSDLEMHLQLGTLQNGENDTVLPELNSSSSEIINFIDDKNDENAILLLPVIIFVSILIILGGTGNSIVFYVYKMRSKNTTKGIFISVLAAFDLLNCGIVMPFEIYDLRNQYKFMSSDFCKAMRFVEVVIVLSSGFTLVAISIDRYMNLCVRSSKALFTPGRAKRACLCCVCLSIFFSWPQIFFAGLKKVPVSGLDITGQECASFSIEIFYGMQAKSYIYILNIVFGVSLLTMIAMYSLIATKLYRRRNGSVHDGLIFLNTSRETIGLPEDNSNTNMARCGYAIGRRGLKMKGSTMIFFSVTIVFIIGFLPHLITRLLRQTHTAFIDTDNGGYVEVLYNFLVRSYMINSAANPFIYSIFHKRFRQEIVRTCRKCIRICRSKV